MGPDVEQLTRHFLHAKVIEISGDRGERMSWISRIPRSKADHPKILWYADCVIKYLGRS